MRDLYRNTNTFMIRTPIFSTDNYFDFFRKDMDFNEIKERLLEICNDSVFREAILVSSKSLYNTIIDFCDGKEIKKFDYFLQSIYKYLIRMSMRPTPFGVFSGVDFGEYTEETSISYEGNNFKKFARPDLEWIVKIVKDLEDNYYKGLTFNVNDSIFIKGERALLIHSTDKEDNNRIGEISIRATKPFMKTYDLARDGIEYNKLKYILIDEYSIEDENKIDNFLKQLIEREFLISKLRPPLTVLDQFDYLINEIKKAKIEIPLVDELLEIKEKLKIYNETSVGHGEKIYLDLYEKMASVASVKNILQVDMKLNLKEKKINKKIISDINDLMNILLELSMSIENPEPFLSKYKQEFIEKYGQDREISLLEMLDNDIGIGPPMNYERPRNNRALDISSNELLDNNVRDYFMEKYFQAVKTNSRNIVIRDNEIKNLELQKINYENIPDSLEINLLVKNKSEDNTDEDFIYYIGPNLGSTSAGKSFGRFSHMMREPNEFFEELDERNIELTNSDEYITCEVSYLPSEVRNANVTRNIHGSEYEMSLFTNGSKDNLYRIKLDDIFIGLENNTFYAKSKTLNKKLLLTINNMLNPQTAPNAIRFLNDISLDEKKLWYKFAWSDVYKDFSYIPAIKYKKFTIMPETWKMNKINMKITKKTEFNEFKKEFNNYRTKYGAPQYVYITFADNRILLNLDNERCVKILYHECKNSFNEIVLNAYENEGINIVKEKDKDYICELVIPLTKVKQEITSNKAPSRMLSSDISSLSKERVKDPFDEWLYLKLYGTSSNVDDLIAYYISEFCNELVEEEVINKYFFMRYIDPEQHIRLRFNSSQEKLLMIYPKIKEWLSMIKKRGLMTYFSIDSYDREIERYGGMELINIAEKVFFFDSIVTEDIIRAKREGSLNFDDEMMGMISVIHYMESFGLPYGEQVDFLRSQVSASDYRDDFKQNRTEYMKLCNSNNDWEGLRESEAGHILVEILNKRRKMVEYYGSKVRENKEVSTDLSILDSIIHLHCNRMFGIDREFEKKVRALASHALYALKHFKS
jgi:thiopeptide-type bacteriocin biosynthesis protein